MSPDAHDSLDAARPDRAHADPAAPRAWTPDQGTRARGPHPCAAGARARIGPAARTRLDAVVAALRISHARYYAGDGTPDPALEAAVCAAAHALRAEGWPVLDVLQAIKECLGGPGGRPHPLPNALADAAVRWCIAHYFDPPASAPGETP